MTYSFIPFKNKIKAVEEWFKKECAQMRTGRATPSILDTVRVDVFGSRVPISNLATITVEDGRTIRLSAWDAAQIKEIERAISLSNLGLSTVTDEKGLRVMFPELTRERRLMLVKLLNEKLENARISLRRERDSVWEDIQKKVRNKELGEDEKFRLKNEMQKIVDETGKQLEEVSGKKAGEIEGQ